MFRGRFSVGGVHRGHGNPFAGQREINCKVIPYDSGQIHIVFKTTTLTSSSIICRRSKNEYPLDGVPSGAPVQLISDALVGHDRQTKVRLGMGRQF